MINRDRRIRLLQENLIALQNTLSLSFLSTNTRLELEKYLEELKGEIRTLLEQRTDAASASD